MKTICTIARFLIAIALIILFILVVALLLGYDTDKQIVVLGILIIIQQQAISGMEDD